ncbi:MAG: pseudouridine synthase [Sphaerochaeta sp.]|jgi:23S rRNA pseudouridine2605 synthase
MIEYPVRLQVYMAKSGCGSRRHCETLIAAGRVTVNMQRVTTLGTKVNEDDVVMVDGRTIEPVEQYFYFALNKPRGYVSTNYDPNERNFARDLLDVPQKPLLFSIGRLDKDSSGLLLFTNDGELTQKLSHPSHEVEKEYLVSASRPIAREDLEAMRRGVYLPDNRLAYRIHRFEILGSRWTRVILTEGKNREIRKLLEHFDYRVLDLIRVRVGPVELGELKTGHWRRLTSDEVRRLHDEKGQKR